METGKNNNHITSSEDSLIQIKSENSCHRMFDLDTQTIHSKSSIDTNLQLKDYLPKMRVSQK